MIKVIDDYPLRNIHDEVSFVIVVRNDLIGFKITWSSIYSQIRKVDEIIVVDGSDCNEIEDYIKSTANFDSYRVKYLQDNKKGVFAAQNIGIKATSKFWVCIINSADKLIDCGRLLITNKIEINGTIDCHIFSQKSVSFDMKSSYVFTPNAFSLWPHQSIVIKKSIHDLYGYYEEQFKYSAEQLFFAKIRKLINYKIYDEVLTEYLLGGMSDRVNITHCKEQYIIRRTIGHGYLTSIFQAWISPFFRVLLRKIIGEKITNKIKRLLFSHYRVG
jgi:hypothetical protein